MFLEKKLSFILKNRENLWKKETRKCIFEMILVNKPFYQDIF